LAVREHAQSFRKVANDQVGCGTLEDAAVKDIVSKYVQVVKLELEAALKLEDWDALGDLFDEYWKHETTNDLETLADLVLVIHSCLVKKSIDKVHQTSKLYLVQPTQVFEAKLFKETISALQVCFALFFHLAIVCPLASPNIHLDHH